MAGSSFFFCLIQGLTIPNKILSQKTLSSIIGQWRSHIFFYEGKWHCPWCDRRGLCARDGGLELWVWQSGLRWVLQFYRAFASGLFFLQDISAEEQIHLLIYESLVILATTRTKLFAPGGLFGKTLQLKSFCKCFVSLRVIVIFIVMAFMMKRFSTPKTVLNL